MKIYKRQSTVETPVKTGANSLILYKEKKELRYLIYFHRGKWYTSNTCGEIQKKPKHILTPEYKLV